MLEAGKRAISERVHAVGYVVDQRCRRRHRNGEIARFGLKWGRLTNKLTY